MNKGHLPSTTVANRSNGRNPPERDATHREPGAALNRAYILMKNRFGHQGWWPGDTPLEICIGAILTQNTNWTNVERAITHLKSTGPLTVDRLLQIPEGRLASLIRPSGYFNLKAKRLRAFLQAVQTEGQGRVRTFLNGNLPERRERLLRIYGIGPETADSMLLYAARHLSFVVDAYTRRVFSRHEWCLPQAAYDDIKDLCERLLWRTSQTECLDYWRDYHAQLVILAKTYCHKNQPSCSDCPLKQLLPCACSRNRTD